MKIYVVLHIQSIYGICDNDQNTYIVYIGIPSSIPTFQHTYPVVSWNHQIWNAGTKTESSYIDEDDKVAYFKRAYFAGPEMIHHFKLNLLVGQARDLGESGKVFISESRACALLPNPTARFLCQPS